MNNLKAFFLEFSLKSTFRVEEIIQQLRAYTVLTKDPTLVLSSHTRWFTTTYSSSSWILDASGLHGHLHTYEHTDTLKNKSFKRKNNTFAFEALTLLPNHFFLFLIVLNTYVLRARRSLNVSTVQKW